MKCGALMLLTVPAGKDRVFNPLHRVYGENRLPRLIEGFDVEKKEFWIKDLTNRYISADELTVLNKEPLAHCYGLGLFVLRKPMDVKC